jgi:hypothetical protein
MPKKVKQKKEQPVVKELSVKGTLAAMKVIVDNFTPSGYTRIFDKKVA